MKVLNIQKRICVLIENGSWIPQSSKLMRELLNDMKEMTILDSAITLNSNMKEADGDSMDAIANSMIESMK